MKVIGIGIDTARYGHVASFVDENLQPATSAFTIKESRQGYEAFRSKLEGLRKRYPEAEFRCRIDAAGVYSSNLEQFLRSFPWPLRISIGSPTVNRNYHRVVFPKNKSDKNDSWALARYSVVERPPETPPVRPELIGLQETVRRLEACSRDLTRSINRLHNLLSRVFPEIESLAPSFKVRWLLELLKRYPTPKKITAARLGSLLKIPYLSEAKAKDLKKAARTSVASMEESVAEFLVLQLVDQTTQLIRMKISIEKSIVVQAQRADFDVFRFLTSIPGIGTATASILMAKIGNIKRFETPKKLVSYFGVFPEMTSSGFDKKGQPRPPKVRMSRKGSNLARAYLWNAARVAITHNPDVKALYARLRAKGKRGDTALGHCMRKLLAQVFHLWSTEQEFKAPGERQHPERD